MQDLLHKGNLKSEQTQQQQITSPKPMFMGEVAYAYMQGITCKEDDLVGDLSDFLSEGLNVTGNMNNFNSIAEMMG